MACACWKHFCIHVTCPLWEKCGDIFGLGSKIGILSHTVIINFINKFNVYYKVNQNNNENTYHSSCVVVVVLF